MYTLIDIFINSKVLNTHKAWCIAGFRNFLSRSYFNTEFCYYNFTKENLLSFLLMLNIPKKKKQVHLLRNAIQ